MPVYSDDSKEYLKQLLKIFRRFVLLGGASGPDSINTTVTSSALPSGGATAANQTTEITSLQIMDDWDENDRAKVNIIVGQAGVEAGSGTVSATTQRVVLATNVALPSGTNTIGNVSLVGTSTANGLSRFRSLTVNSTAQAIKASSGNLYGWNIVNLHTGTIYVKIYNIAAASVNPAADTPVLTLIVPPNGSVYQQPDCIQDSLTTAISVRAVTESGDTGTTAPGTLPIIEIKYL